MRKSILMGELRPGDPVSEIGVARAQGVSQTTVREALVKLEHAGLVRRVPNIGTFVTQMTPREIRERLRLRVILEGLAGSEAARNIRPSQLEDIGHWLRAIASAVASNDYFEAAHADLELHRAIWRSAGDSTLYQMLDQLTVPLFAFVSMERQRLREDLSRAVEAHDPIVQAIRAQDSDAAREALRVHIEKSYAEFLGGPMGQQA
ncbi:MAG: GntR family transcriptional regulator [Bryobacterales bacterium]|nr:GntR family transcriptional regulator [Bryobacterales bacterium]